MIFFNEHHQFFILYNHWFVAIVCSTIARLCDNLIYPHNMEIFIYYYYLLTRGIIFLFIGFLIILFPSSEFLRTQGQLRLHIVYDSLPSNYSFTNYFLREKVKYRNKFVVTICTVMYIIRLTEIRTAAVAAQNKINHLHIKAVKKNFNCRLVDDIGIQNHRAVVLNLCN